MAESLFARVRRVISANLGDAADTMERAGGASVMREAIREVGRAIDDVRAERDAAAARRLQAVRQQQLFRDQLAGLDEKARFAIAQNRDDLAEAALARQLDFEMQVEHLDAVQAEATSEADRLDGCLFALTTRLSEMTEALAAFETARRDVSPSGGGPAHPDQHTERRVERAEDAFNRAMIGAGGGAGISRADVQTAAGVAEIAKLQRHATITQRMSALRSRREGKGEAAGEF